MAAKKKKVPEKKNAGTAHLKRDLPEGADELLRESEGKFREIFNKVNDAIHLNEIGDDARPGKFIDVNDVACKMLQYSREEMLQHTPLDLATEYHSPPVDTILEELTTVGHAVFETGHKRKDGTIVLVEINAHKITFMGKEVILSVVRDITERKRAEEALQIQHNLALALTTCHTLNEAFELILDATLQAEGLDSGGIYMADPVTGALDIAVHRGLSPEFVEHTSHFDADAPQVKRAKTGTPFYGRYGNIMSPGKDEIHDREGLTALASIPVLHDSNLVAIMNMASHVRDDIPVHTRHLLETMAAQISGALAYILSEEALYKSESHLSDIINFLPDAMFAVDENGTVIVWNRAIEKMTGVPAEQILGKGNYEYALPFYHERRPILVDLIRNNDPVTAKRYPDLQRIGNTFVAETFIPHFNNGKGAHIWCTASALYGQVGKPKGAIEIIRDITEHKRAEEALNESETRYREFFTTSRDCVFITSPDGRFIDFNDATLEMFGYDNREEMSKVPIPSLYAHSEDRTVFLNLIVRDGYVKEFPVQLKRRDGTVIDSLITSVPLRNPDGTIKALIGSARDITGRKRTVEALNESERRFRELSDLLPQIVYETDANGILTYANRIAFEWFGYTEDEFGQGLNVLQMLAPYDRERGGADFRAMVEGKGRMGIADEYRALRKDGGTFPISIYSSPVIVQGRVTGLRGIIIDNTERTRAEEALQFTRHSVDSAIDTMVTVAQDGHFVDVNDGFCRKSGYSRNELLSMTVHDIDPDYAAEIGSAFWNKLKQSGSLTFETTHRTKEGRTYPVEVTATHFGYKGNEYHCAFARDITDRKRAEEALSESEERYRTVFENTGTAMVVVEENNLISLANAEFAKLSGFSKNDIERKKCWTEFVVREDLERMLAQHRLRRQNREKALTHYEFRFVTKSGDIRNIYLSIDVIPGTKKTVASLLDITERKRAEELYRTVFENTGTAMIIIEEDTTISHVNEEMENIWGYSKEEIEGRIKWPTLVAEEDLEKMLEYHRLRRIDPDSAPRYYEFRFIHKNGELRDAALTAAMIPGTKKSVISLRDITERKQVEEALRKSEERFRTIIHSMQLGIVIIDEQTHTILDANKKALEMIGAGTDVIVGSVCHRFICPAESGRCPVTDLKQAIDSSERVLITLQGEKIPILKSVITTNLGGKKVLIESFIDITERKRAEMALRESEDKYRRFFSTSRDCVFITSEDGRWVDLNDAAVELLGYASRAELMGVKIRNLYADPDRRKEHTRIISETGISKEYPVDLLKKDGTIMHTLVTTVARKDENGNVIGFQGTVRDITELKRAEEALIFAGKKLNLLNSITRHDINNQLVALDMFIQLSREMTNDPAMRELFDKEARISAIIAEQVIFTRDYQELGVKAPGWQNVHTIIRRAAAALPMRLVRIDVDRTDLEVFADPLFEKVFYNLIDNALRYGGDKMTTIRIFSHETTEGLVIAFEDDGDGIPADDKKHLFERGFGKNTGLGLFLVREILSITGLSITETGEPNKGARFEIAVPKGAFRFNGSVSTIGSQH